MVNKYRNKKTEYNGVKYDSKKESEYAFKLDILKNAKDITERVLDIERQVTYKLQVNAIHICKYILDFKVTFADGRIEYIDVKGYKKGGAYSIFKIKKSLMEACHGILIKEV